jgi:hypothetical protein
LEKWALKRKYTPETDTLDLTIVRFKDASSSEGIKFYLFATTKRLLGMCQNTSHLCIDAIYKVVFQGFPFFLVGTTDRSRAFHPFGFASSNETYEAFRYILESLVEFNNTIFEYTYEP